MTGSAHIIRANALRIPLAAGSVHLAFGSPGYFGLRDYQDGGKSVRDQIGAEATPQEHLRALWAVADEMWRVLVPWGSFFVNYGEKYSGSGGHNNVGISSRSTLQGNGHVGGVGKAGTNKIKATRRQAPDAYVKNPDWARPKSLMGIPWAFALGLINPALYRDHIDPSAPGKPHPRWILRAEVVWDKPNGLPESVDDRVRRAHETILHFTKQEHYFAAVDEIRESQVDPERSGTWNGSNTGRRRAPREEEGNNWAGWQGGTLAFNPLGKLPGSVWRIPSEPLKLPTWRVVRAGRTVQWFTGKEDDAYALALKWMRAMGLSGGRPSLRRVMSHFAAFPTELPRRIILGFSPSAICTACGEGRWPVVDAKRVKSPVHGDGSIVGNRDGGPDERQWDGLPRFNMERTILGYACACPEPTAPTRPSVVLDPFSGTGTTIGVAKELSRTGVGTDLSHSYCAVARWRVEESGQFAKVEQRTWASAQGSLL